MLTRSTVRRATLGAAVLMASIAVGVSLASGKAGVSGVAGSHGNLLHLVTPGLGANASQSNNWFGYNQGTLEQGSKQFHSISGDWTVPTATQHTPGQAENSSDWIGIGGGCVNADCSLTDSTLIQTGTEQDVDATGKASYSAWYELVPAPSLDASMTVAPGDHMHADITETVSGADVWKITLQDVTRNETFTTTVPYPSTHLTAEWIEETPLLIGTDAGLASLPNLSNPAFDLSKTNGAGAGLKASEAVQLTDANGTVIGTPSAPDAQADGFAACSWATSC